ncbi:MAG: dienelactone hydrolase family protein [Acidobacteria bacterium]|nr:dienelactone hydrolase family protein [Acidobacteriota bacterium]
MSILLASVLLAVAGQATAPALLQRSFVVPDGGRVLYGLSVPAGYKAGEPRPLVVALHPGGPRTPYYGFSFLRGIVSPALRDLGAIIIAPDCPAPGSWSDPPGERAVLALVDGVMKEYAIDRRRILVTGFSMGGRGTWFMASRHADLFTAAIPIAGAPGDEPLDRLGRIPTYIIHSRDDQVVPFASDERAARELEKLGRMVRFEALEGIGHYEMGGYVDALARGGRWVMERWSR